jgi:excisionase family DNA binding protein
MFKGLSNNFAYSAMFKEFPDVVGIKEICEMLNIGSKKAYKLVKTGELRSIPCSKSIKVPKISVIEYVLRNI